ncbi:hypothetical protein HNY73_013915 [Argiope bruennichi]|uniref:Uncharacterized protein n=1 Tax=Argiope bruennichi TaxID=94029 RepID=A0A8T0ENY4_ARGBR|nr:hypothetical protein HNY73_013915 [Argiope bruennichi]
MKLFWIIILCSAILTVALSKPSGAKRLSRESSKVHSDTLAAPRVMVKRSPEDDNGMNTKSELRFILSSQFAKTPDLEDPESNFKMKLFWIIALCAAVLSIALTKPSGSKRLTRESSNLHSDTLTDPRVVVKRSVNSDNWMNRVLGATDSQNRGLLTGIFRFVGGILKFIGKIF